MSAPGHSVQTSRPLLAIFFMLLSGLMTTAMLSGVKQLTGDLHPFQVAFIRCMIGFAVLLPVVWQAGGWSVLRTSNTGLHLLRGALNAGGLLLFFLAVSLAPLATVSAIGFASPLFAALLAIVIFREKVGVRRWGGLIIGFVGTLIILRPGVDVVQFGALMALISSLMWAGAMIVIKHLTDSEHPLAITTWAALYVGIFCLVPALFVWKWPSGEQWLWLIFVGSLGSITQFCLAKALALADTTVVLPFDFMKLVWASLFGLVLFAEIPDPWAWVGGAVIFVSSFYIAYRERTQKIQV